MQHGRIIDRLADKQVEMEHIGARQVGQDHTDRDGKQEQRLELLHDRKIHKHAADHKHDESFPPFGFGALYQSVNAGRL